MQREFKKFCFRQNPFFLPFALLFGLLSVCAVHNFLFYKSGAAVRKEVQTSQQNKQNTNCSPRVKQEENKNICSELLPSCNTKKTKTFSQKRNNLNSEICWPWFDCDVVTFFFLSRVVRVLTRLIDWLTSIFCQGRRVLLQIHSFKRVSHVCRTLLLWEIMLQILINVFILHQNVWKVKIILWKRCWYLYILRMRLVRRLFSRVRG